MESVCFEDRAKRGCLAVLSILATGLSLWTASIATDGDEVFFRALASGCLAVLSILAVGV